MKLLLASLFCLVASLGEAQVATPAEPIDLFNGKDFSGFKFFMRSNSPPDKTWNITINVNGKSTNKISGANVTSGFIGIQSEGADIEVRKIFLAPCPGSKLAAI